VRGRDSSVSVIHFEGLALFDLYRWEAIDWDDEEDEEGNLQHCLRHGVDEIVVDEVLRTRPVEIKVRLESAEFAIVGPNGAWSAMWTLLMATSWKRGDWLRPVTGWESKTGEIVQWEATTNLTWGGQR
jgi:hypothetical protein